MQHTFFWVSTSARKEPPWSCWSKSEVAMKRKSESEFSIFSSTLRRDGVDMLGFGKGIKMKRKAFARGSEAIDLSHARWSVES